MLQAVVFLLTLSVYCIYNKLFYVCTYNTRVTILMFYFHIVYFKLEVVQIAA